MLPKVIYYIGLLACLALVGCCFMPWVHYNSIDLTFTGFNVTRFAGGDYYGKAGIPITILSSLIFILMLLPKMWGKRVNLFLAGLLFAYCIRTYIIFTSSLFKGDVEKFAGIYLIIILSFVILVACIFPKEEKPAGI